MALLEQIPLLAAAAIPKRLLDAIRENARVQGGGTKKDWESEDVYTDVKEALSALRAWSTSCGSCSNTTPSMAAARGRDRPVRFAGGGEGRRRL